MELVLGQLLKTTAANDNAHHEVVLVGFPWILSMMHSMMLSMTHCTFLKQFCMLFLD